MHHPGCEADGRRRHARLAHPDVGEQEVVEHRLAEARVLRVPLEVDDVAHTLVERPHEEDVQLLALAGGPSPLVNVRKGYTEVLPVVHADEKATEAADSPDLVGPIHIMEGIG